MMGWLIESMRALFVSMILIGWTCSASSGAVCPAPISLGQHPSRLVVVVPATGQGPDQWKSFLERLKNDPRSDSIDWLVFDHQIKRHSFGNARETADQVASCIDEKVTSKKYQNITLIGHSIGGMLIRRAYLQSSGAVADQKASDAAWAKHVDKILLFSSVNKGVRRDVTWWSPIAYWVLRTFPHPHLVLEDMALGSDFIADTRIAWIRLFGKINDASIGSNSTAAANPPRVVQFWGTQDSIVSESDNADLEAFSGGPVIVRVSGAQHGNLQRLEPEFTPDAKARWDLFSNELFAEPAVRQAVNYPPRRVLIIARGIRDSSISDWVSELKQRAIESKAYGPGNVIDIEYGYFSAAHFAMRPIRRKNIPAFRDIYAQLLAENPSTEFDFIGHSNGTYIFGESVLSTPSMQFRNVVLAAPVLPTDFDWSLLFSRNQVRAVRYDVANLDWPVGILCTLLNGIGFSDVGPSGVVLFGEGTMADFRVQKVGWYNGGHSASLYNDRNDGIDNRPHLLNFAVDGSDLSAAFPLRSELGWMQQASRATPWIFWLMVVILVFGAWRYRFLFNRSLIVGLFILLVVGYALMDIV